MTAARVYSLRWGSTHLLPFWKALQDQKICLTQAPQIIAFVLDLGACEIFMYPLIVESLFPIILWLFHMQAPLAFKPRHSRVHLPSSGSRVWGAWCETWTPDSLGRTSTMVIILLFLGHLLWGCRSLLHCVSALPPISVFLLYIFDCKRSFLFSLFSLIVLIDSSSVNSCHFSVPVEGNELRVFLLCHLDYNACANYFINTDLFNSYDMFIR